MADSAVADLLVCPELSEPPKSWLLIGWVRWLCLLVAVASAIAAVLAHVQRASLMPSLRSTAVVASDYEFVLAAALALVATAYGGFMRRWRLSAILELPGFSFRSRRFLRPACTNLECTSLAHGTRAWWSTRPLTMLMA